MRRDLSAVGQRRLRNLGIRSIFIFVPTTFPVGSTAVLDMSFKWIVERSTLNPMKCRSYVVQCCNLGPSPKSGSSHLHRLEILSSWRPPYIEATVVLFHIAKAVSSMNVGDINGN